MKKCILSLMSAMLGCAAFAANCVTTTQLSTDYANQTVTFTLTWNGCSSTTTHSNKVWCFVDFRGSAPDGTKGAWTRAVISETPSVVNGTYAAGNASGFYVTGTNGQSATVTVKLGNAPAMFDWCAFATDYPPNIGAVNGGAYTLRGSQAFEVNGNLVAGNQSSGNISSLTDATGCPGCIAIRDFKFSSSGIGIPCCPNLTAVNGYCRDLAVDEATNITCNGVEYEVKLNSITTGWYPGSICPAGWVWPTPAQLKCMWANKERTGLDKEKNWFWSNSTAGWEFICDFGNSNTVVVALWTVDVPAQTGYCNVPTNIKAGTLGTAWFNSNVPTRVAPLRCVR